MRCCVIVSHFLFIFTAKIHTWVWKKPTLILRLDCVEKEPDSQLMGKEQYISNRSRRNTYVYLQPSSKFTRKVGESHRWPAVLTNTSNLSFFYLKHSQVFVIYTYLWWFFFYFPFLLFKANFLTTVVYYVYTNQYIQQQLLKIDLRFLFEHFWTLLSHKSQGSKSQQQSGYRSYASSQIDNEHHSPTTYKKEKSKALHAMSEYIPLLCPDFCLH